MRKDLLEIINYYGVIEQLKYIHSEYFELDEAIFHYENGIYWGNGETEHCIRHIAEEIADVMVMLKQLQYYYDIEDSEIEKIMLEKIDRQLRRIEESKNAIEKRDIRE